MTQIKRLYASSGPEEIIETLQMVLCPRRSAMRWLTVCLHF